MQYFFQKTYIKTGKNYFLKIYLPPAPICAIGSSLFDGLLKNIDFIATLDRPPRQILKISNIQGFFFAETNISWG